LRSLLSLCAALFVLVAFTAGLVARPADARERGTSLERKVIRLVNVVRVRHHLPQLFASRRLGHAARLHSADMVRRGFLTHLSSDGTAMFDRVRRHFPARLVGETVAAVHGTRGLAGTVVRMWMASPPHRAIVLGPSFRRMGVGGRRGFLQANRAMYVTADFAGR
jgi:uncharacterized protein YkwD